ncbi:MAG: aldolase/citrate lyase family protein [Mariniphaga sp.]|jgi:citrate lyase subunit beta/citryl-CoA lyase|nr:aldolase/citrate lyase family protein [Mariniphaga sp.]
MKVSSGNKGDTVRSDCYIELSDNPDAGNQILLKSKVKTLYGKSIEELCLNVLGFFGVENVRVEVEDSGALPFVIAARLEATIQQYLQTDKMYLLERIPENDYEVQPDRFRRTRLYIPGNNPKMMINAGIYGSDAIILDLEDSVHPSKKTEAAILVRNALCRVNFYGAEKMVRINQVPEGLKDLKFVVPYGVHTVVIPKCESPDDVLFVEQHIQKIKGKAGAVHLIPIIESALGVENAFEIAVSSENVVAMAIGLEDYTTDIGAQRTEAGNESFFARSRVINAARAAGIQPLDSVFSGFEDIEALSKTAQNSKALGFEGLGCIHPGQIKIVNESFSPSEKEIEKAKKIVFVYQEAEKHGLGVVAVDAKMVDLPVVKRAQKTIENAIVFGLLNQNWMESYGNELG